MILRIFEVVIRRGKGAAFAGFFHGTAIPRMKATNGFVTIPPGAARPERPREFGFAMVRESLDALKAFVGEDYDSAQIDPAEAELVATRTIRHHDLVAA